MTGSRLQVADAEAATARLVAHMTQSSPNQDHKPLQLLTAPKAGDVLSAHDTNSGQRQQQLQPQQQHSRDLENIPQVQQHAGKCGSSAQAGQAVAAAGVVAGGKKQPAKRRKVSKDMPAVHPTAAEGVGSGKPDELAPDAKEIVGRVVQQQFETGIFKVGLISGTAKCALKTQACWALGMVAIASTAHMHFNIKLMAGAEGWPTSAASLCRVL